MRKEVRNYGKIRYGWFEKNITFVHLNDIMNLI